jgi:hypothetical protein
MNREPKTPLDWVQWWFEVLLFSTILTILGVVTYHVSIAW